MKTTAEVIADLDQVAAGTAPDDYPALATSVTTWLLGLTLKMGSRPKETPTHDPNLLSVAEAAKRLGVSEGFLYNNRRLPFRVKVGSRLLFSANGIERYIRNRTGSS